MATDHPTELMDCVKTCFRKYAHFRGRARRPEYWYFILFNFLVGMALNVVDDDLPTRAAFIAQHRALAGWPRLVLPMPYAVWMGLARMLSPLGARLPGLLQERILRARLMPLSYPNTALRQRLGGHDPALFDQRLADAIREGKS